MKKIIVTGGTGRFGSILKKYKTKHEIIFPVIFLSSEASSYITGTTMLADGVFTIK